MKRKVLTVMRNARTGEPCDEEREDEVLEIEIDLEIEHFNPGYQGGWDDPPDGPEVEFKAMAKGWPVELTDDEFESFYETAIEQAQAEYDDELEEHMSEKDGQ